MRLSAVIALLLTLLTLPGFAATTEWSVVPDRSEVKFIYVESGVQKEGEFERFRGSGMIDPAAPEAARLDIEVETRSISLGSGLIDAFATSAEWFDSEHTPYVIYRLTKLTRIDGSVYMSTGDITIRGIRHGVSAPVTLSFHDGEARARGELKLDRGDYGLGVGPSAAFVEIGREVAVRFDLIARPVR